MLSEDTEELFRYYLEQALKAMPQTVRTKYPTLQDTTLVNAPLPEILTTLKQAIQIKHYQKYREDFSTKPASALLYLFLVLDDDPTLENYENTALYFEEILEDLAPYSSDPLIHLLSSSSTLTLKSAKNLLGIVEKHA